MSVVAKTKENLNKCRCNKCPTYSLACKVKAIPEGIADMLKRDISEEKHMEMMFCAFEPSKCIKEEKGCTSCHNPQTAPLPRRHPPKEQCLICHKMHYTK